MAQTAPGHPATAAVLVTDPLDRLAFLFAGPALTEGDADRITLQHEELDAWRWATRAEAESMLHPAIAARIAGSIQAPGRAVYRETRHGGTL